MPKKNIEIYNKKARFDYQILESFEAGIVLLGEEIKAIRAGRANITGSYAKVINGEVFWLGGNFNLPTGDNQRTKKLLVKNEQIRRLIGKTQEEGLALIPLKLYLTRGKAKLELGLGRGLKKYDKRERLKKRVQEREIDRRVSEKIQ
jgi:SsrA-binding protein